MSMAGAEAATVNDCACGASAATCSASTVLAYAGNPAPAPTTIASDAAPRLIRLPARLTMVAWSSRRCRAGAKRGMEVFVKSGGFLVGEVAAQRHSTVHLRTGVRSE